MEDGSRTRDPHLGKVAVPRPVRPELLGEL
jgi:hypothetical protein